MLTNRASLKLYRIRARIPSSWLHVAEIYFASRIVVYFAAIVAYLFFPPHSPSYYATHPDEYFPTRWDGFWYTYIARHGYSSDLSGPPPYERYSPWAFFPLFPLVIRATSVVTGLGVVKAGLVLNLLLGILLALVIYQLTTDTTGDERVGDRAVLLLFFWPGSAVFSLIYSEPLFLLLAGLALLLLLRRRWWAAGLAAALTTATRATGVAVVAACVVAAIMAIVRAREWRSLAAPLLSPLGLVAFMAYGHIRTGELNAWGQAEARWHQKLDFSRALPHFLSVQLGHHAANALWALMVLVGLIAVVLALGVFAIDRFRLPAEQLVYTAVTLFFALGYTSVGTRPRMVSAMLPLFWVMARRLHGRALELTALVLSSILGLATFLYLAGRHVVP